MNRIPDERRVCGTLLHLDARRAETVYGEYRVETFLNLTSHSLVLALCYGDIGGNAPLLARVHSSCMTSETFGGCDCDCAGQLDAALDAIAQAGRGIIFYLLQEGRGAGFSAKARDRMMVQASRDRVTTFDAYARMGLGRDYRRYDEVGFAAAALGVSAPLALLSNNPDKVAALQRVGIAIDRVLPLQRQASPFNLHYLTAKSRSGHALGTAAEHVGAAAEPPERVVYFDPHPLLDRPRFVRVASYMLPIRAAQPDAGGPHWFRLHAYFDLEARRERVIFAYARNPQASPLVRVQMETLLERFPLRARPQHLGWRDVVERIVRRGNGCALFVLHDDPAVTADDEDVAWLLAQHVGGQAGEMLIDGPHETATEAALRAGLKRHGVSLASGPDGG